MLKALTFGLSLVALAYPLAAQAQYGKVPSVANTAATQGATSSSGVGFEVKTNEVGENAAAPTGSVKKPAPSVSMNKDEKVEIFFDDFNIKKTLGGQVFCQMTFYVDNRTNKMLDSILLDLVWSGIATKLNFSAVEPSDIKTLRYTLAGPGCYTMGENPTLNISRCLMRAKDASGKVVDVPEPMCKQAVVFK